MTNNILRIKIILQNYKDYVYIDFDLIYKNGISKSGQCLKTLDGHNHWVSSVGYSPDGQFIVSGSFDQSIKIWDAETGQCLNTLVGHNNWIHNVGYSPDGQFIVSGSSGDHSIKIWD